MSRKTGVRAGAPASSVDYKFAEDESRPRFATTAALEADLAKLCGKRIIDFLVTRVLTSFAR